MSKRRSGWIKGLTLLLLLGGAAGWYFYVRPPAASAITYRTANVSKGEIVQTVMANGTINPVVTVSVGSQVSGNILRLYADFNSRVTNGQLVAELDPATYQSRVTQADGDLASARAQLELARLNVRRATNLLANHLLAEADCDQTVAELAQRDAAVKVREAALTNAMVDLSRTRIFSPIDGTVISRNVDIGQTVQASFTAPTLFTIANDLTQMEISAMVSEADIGGVEEGQAASFTVEAFPGRTFTGVVKQVRFQPATNQNVVNYATMVAVSNPDLKLKPGMTANVTITTAKKEGVLRVPNAALRFRVPEGAVLKTNAASLAGAGTNAPATTTPADDGLPEFPGGWQPPPEVRQRMIARYDKNNDGKLDASERAAMQEAMQRRRAEGGGFGMGGGGQMGEGGGMMGGERRPRPATQQTSKTVYLVSTNTTGPVSFIELQPVTIRMGISDGTQTEVLSGVSEGDVVATIAIVPNAAATPAPASNPFGGGPFGGRRP